MIASDLYKQVVGNGYQFDFYQRYVKIDCDFSGVLKGESLKRHLKAYGDLLQMLEMHRPMVETYFSVELTSGKFEALCYELYTGSRFEKPQVKPTVQRDIHVHPPHPYTLECQFNDEQIKELYFCIVGHQIFDSVTLEEVRAFFSGKLDHSIRCMKSSRFGYLMRELAIHGFITNQYQAAIARCGYILTPRDGVAMTQKHMQDAVANAGSYTEKEDKTWKRTINQSMDRLLLLECPLDAL